jgi:hypothetical protein
MIKALILFSGNYSQPKMEFLGCDSVIEGQKMNPEDISEVALGWGDKKCNCPSTIEIHNPMLRSIGRDRSLHVGPFGDKISEHLGLYRPSAPKINEVYAELYRPFNGHWLLYYGGCHRAGTQ